MPIKPENAHRYPADWPQIRAQILARAGDRCEGSPLFPKCRAPNHWWRNNDSGEITDNPMQADSWALVDGDSVAYIVLTIGHLNHTPEDCRPENLRAWCQRCHLNHDAKHHAQTSYATRRIGKAIADLFR
jgi:hypothetical protein